MGADGFGLEDFEGAAGALPEDDCGGEPGTDAFVVALVGAGAPVESGVLAGVGTLRAGMGAETGGSSWEGSDGSVLVGWSSGGSAGIRVAGGALSEESAGTRVDGGSSSADSVGTRVTGGSSSEESVGTRVA